MTDYNEEFVRKVYVEARAQVTGLDERELNREFNDWILSLTERVATRALQLISELFEQSSTTQFSGSEVAGILHAIADNLSADTTEEDERDGD